MQKFQKSARVRIQNPASVQHGRIGLIVDYQFESRSYLIDFDGQFIEVAEDCLVKADFDWEAAE